MEKEIEVLRDYETGELHQASKEQVELNNTILSRITPFEETRILIVANPS